MFRLILVLMIFMGAQSFANDQLSKTVEIKDFIFPKNGSSDKHADVIENKVITKLPFTWKDSCGKNVTITKIPTKVTYCYSGKKFWKPGNNGTVSCKTFCEGSEHGPVGTCIKGSASGTKIGCDIVQGSAVGCYCKSN